MPESKEMNGMEDIRQKIVSQMQAYGVFLQDHAEDIVGKLSETYVAADGITVSFKVLEHDSVPTLRFSLDCIAMEAIEV